MELKFLENVLAGVLNGARPYLYSGIILLACFAIVHYYLYLRLRDTGYHKTIFDFLLVEVPLDYLRLRTKYGWSPWPAYLMWPFLLIGAVLFVIGVSRL
jgi:hypothetical protein